MAARRLEQSTREQGDSSSAMPIEFSDLTELPALPGLAESMGAPTQGIDFSFPLIETPDPPDTVAPVVGPFVPALGSVLPPTQPISFPVTDDSGAFRRIIVHARFADGLEEVVHNGDSFRGLYGGGNSARVITAGGFSYTILRGGGWPQGGPVTINVFAIDVEGNEAA